MLMILYVNMARNKSQVERKTFGFRLDIELVKKLKITAVNKDQAANILLEESIRDLLEKYEKDE
jgi:hypothetical protein